MMDGMPHLVELSLLLLLVFLIGCVIGNVLRSRVFPPKAREVEGADAAVPEPAGDSAVADAPRPAPTEEAAGTKPALLQTPRETGKDNLKRIKGIGPKIESSLNELGVFHFDQIAAWEAAEIAWIDERLAFHGRIVREQWVTQAKALKSD